MKRIIREATAQDVDQLSAIYTVCKQQLQHRKNRFEYDPALWHIYLKDARYRVLVLEGRIITGVILAYETTNNEWQIAQPLVLQEYKKPYDCEMLYDTMKKRLASLQLASAL